MSAKRELGKRKIQMIGYPIFKTESKKVNHNLQLVVKIRTGAKASFSYVIAQN